MRYVLCFLPLYLSFFAQAEATQWRNPLRYLGKLDSPLVEVTPFVFKDRFYYLENWQKQWEFPGSADGSMTAQDEIRIRDVADDRIVSIPLQGHGLGMALVHDGRLYVFAGDWGTGAKWNITEIKMVASDDLIHWTEPVVVLKAGPREKFFNVSVCRGAERFVMLVESNDPTWPAFTFKYFTSDDLIHWEPVPGAQYGREKYVGGPALYYEGSRYYTLYLESLGKGFYETRVARSTDLIHWQDAPSERPVATFNPKNKVHPLRPEEIRETNASDLELCYWKGKTRVIYTGGDQHLAGDLQHAEYEGTVRELLEYFFMEPELPAPSANQQRYQEKQLGCFVHFGPASYIGGGDYLTAPEASRFNPEELDAAQWVRAAKSIGARHIVLTAKHHNGFCLWPTESTDYSVHAAPWKNGQGDVVREFVDAARKHGIAPGLYMSAGDTHQNCKATPEPRGVRKVIGDTEAYFPIFMRQLTELLTNYGELEVIWFDGAYNPFDADVLGVDGRPNGNRYTSKITAAVRELQPKAVIMGAAHSDLRWSGSEQGEAPYPLWNVVEPGTGRAHWLADDASGWAIPEANIHTRRSWFWSPGSDQTLKTAARMLAAHQTSIGHGANLLVNLTPDTRGLVPDAEMSMLNAFGKALREERARMIASTTGPGNWEEGHTLRLQFDHEQKVDSVTIEEDLTRGQRIRGYRIELLRDGKWQPLVEGQSIGRKRIQPFEPVTTNALRLKILESTAMPHIRLFSAAAMAMSHSDPLDHVMVTAKPEPQRIVARPQSRASAGTGTIDSTVQHNHQIKQLAVKGSAASVKGSTASVAGARPKLEKIALKKLRKQAANRQRRIVYNDDGCHGTAGNSAEDWLGCRVRHVINTQVDTISYCTGGGGLFWAHQPKVGEVLGAWVEDGHGQYVKQMRDILSDMKQRGTDPLTVVIDYAHQHNREVFWSYRMNNPECSFATWGLSQRKRDHPEYIMGVQADFKKYPHSNPKAWYTLSDYEHPEVRDHIVRIFEDVCQRYDIDGVELDYIRHPLFFRPNLEGKPVEPSHVEMMTDMVRRIRAVSERESIKRGRPILVTVRAPLSVKSCMAIGIDIHAFLEEDLMDIMIAGQDYIQMAVASALKDMVDLGHQYQVPVYALLVPPKPYDRYRHDNRAWWAAATNRFYWGADGIYLFNLFPSKPDERFSQLGSVETLKGRDKVYAIDNPAQEAVLGTFKMAMVGPNRLPIVLTPGKFAIAKLPVGEDIRANTPTGKTVSTLLRLRLAGLLQGDKIKVQFNGHPLVLTEPVEPLTTTPSSAWFHIQTDPKWVQAGYNLIGVQLDTNLHTASPVVLDGLDLVVSYIDQE